MACLSTTRTIIGGLFAALVASSIQLAAAETPVEETFLRYHAAIHAAVVCEDRNLEQDGVDDPDAAAIAENQSRMGAVIDARVQNQIAAGRRLSLIEEAKADVDATVGEKGCDSAEAQGWLQLFHAELEPVVVE